VPAPARRDRVLYVSPLKALSNDIHRNLEAPLKGIREALAALDLPDVEIRTAVRTGDTSQAERGAHAPPGAAHRRHHARVLYTCCWVRNPANHAVDLPHGHRG
jgi:ATP-dependent helicase YprA (DUF1998 family)